MTPQGKIDQYIREVCSKIGSKEVHETIALELESHLLDKVAELREAGLSESEAVNRAIAEMGDPDLVGAQLHQSHKPRMEWSLLGIVAVLVGVGLVTIYSLESSNSLMGTNGWLFGRQLVSVLLGTAVFVVLAFGNYRKIKAYCKHLFVGTLALILYTLIFGEHVNGSPRLDLGITSIDFIGVSPLFLIIALAGICSEWKWGYRRDFACAALLLLIPLLMYAAAPDMFAALLYTVGFFVVTATSQEQKMHRLLLVGLVATVFWGLFWLTAPPHRIDSLLIFLHPYDDPFNQGYVSVQLMNALQSAGLWGNGFAADLSKLPAVESDFVFAYIVHSFGWVTGGTIALIGCVMFARIYRVARQIKDRFGSILIKGLMTGLCFQFFWNILMSVGLLPLVGINLPFISFGGTQFVCQMATLGLIVGIYRRKDIVPSMAGSK